ncbi:MAG: prolyl oligopeptidase family serine peptidase [Phycisphaerales bacterium]
MRSQTLWALAAFGSMVALSPAAPAPRAALVLPASHTEVAPPGAEEQAALVEELASEIEDLEEDDNRAAYALSMKLANAEGDAGFRALREKWSSIESPSVKQQMMQTFYSRRLENEFDESAKKDRIHPRVVDVLDLGARDQSAAVQASSLRWLKKIALVDFAEDFEAYYPWFEGQYGKDANEALAKSIQAWVKRASETKGEGVRPLADFIEENGELLRDTGTGRRASEKAGWLEVLEGWLDGGEAEMQTAMRLVGGMRMRRPELEKVVLPRIQSGKTGAVRTWAIAMLGDAKAIWAVDALHGLLTESFTNEAELRLVLPPMCRTLAGIGDARSIPILIAAMEAEGTSASVQTVNTSGLAPLTGVRIKAGQDAAWWRDWWEKNRGRFAENVRALEVPPSGKALSPKDDGKPKPPEDAGADVLDVPSADVRAGFDNDKRYFMIGVGKENAAPSTGYKVLVVLPGGDGGAGFNLFCRRIFKSGLPDAGAGWVVAQMVAPRWEEKQFDRVVWPIEKNPYRGEKKSSKFSTEEFADAVVADLKTRIEIDPNRVYVMGWSSGGPPAYALMLREKALFKGAFTAMSVFKPEQTEGLQFAGGGDLGAKGAGGEEGFRGKGAKRYYILHSEQDRTVPVRFANDAFEMLNKSKGRAKLATYEGGHGWHGEVFANIRTGMEFLSGPEQP